METAQAGDLIQLVGKDDKRYILRLQPGKRFHTHRGIVEHDGLIGLAWGNEAKTHLGFPFLMLIPSIHDLILNIKRTTQIVYPKESGFVIIKMNIGPGSRVLEAGTGSGGLTIALAHAVGPTGRVYSYEERDEMSDAARVNLERLGLADRVELKVRDINEGFDERGVDALFLDVREPWLFLEQVREALACGGFFGALVPTTNQIQELVRFLKRFRFMDVEVLELMERHYKPVPDRIRPVDRSVVHTGYLIFARSTSRPPVEITEEELAVAAKAARDAEEPEPHVRGKPLPLP